MITVLVLLAATLVLELATPFWWWVMAVPFVYGAAGAPRGGRAFLAGFGAAGLLWLGAAAYHYLTGSRLIAERMAALFRIGDARLLVLGAGLAAALAAGLAGYAGYALKRLVKGPAKPDGKERA